MAQDAATVSATRAPYEATRRKSDGIAAGASSNGNGISGHEMMPVAEDGFTEVSITSDETPQKGKKKSARAGLFSGESSSSYNGDEQNGSQLPETPGGTAVAGPEKKIDWVLVMVKCTVPALFVVLSAVIAIPLNNVLSDDLRESTEQVAGGALIVTYAFELTKGY